MGLKFEVSLNFMPISPRPKLIKPTYILLQFCMLAEVAYMSKKVWGGARHTRLTKLHSMGMILTLGGVMSKKSTYWPRGKRRVDRHMVDEWYCPNRKCRAKYSGPTGRGKYVYCIQEGCHHQLRFHRVEDKD